MSRVRDNDLLDAIQAISPVEFSGPTWRVVRDGRDPLVASRAGGRWDDGTFDVLYTSEMRKGAIAETRFYIMKGQPVAPSKPSYRLFELRCTLSSALKLLDLSALQALGVNTSRFGAACYTQRRTEYTRTQEVGEAAFFLGFDGLVVPNARYTCLNVVLFDRAIDPNAKVEVKDHGVIDVSL
ncbi:MAG: RES family NAD+ phosphorylase [Pseudomonadota bacterium]